MKVAGPMAICHVAVAGLSNTIDRWESFLLANFQGSNIVLHPSINGLTEQVTAELGPGPRSGIFCTFAADF